MCIRDISALFSSSTRRVSALFSASIISTARWRVASATWRTDSESCSAFRRTALASSRFAWARSSSASFAARAISRSRSSDCLASERCTSAASVFLDSIKIVASFPILAFSRSSSLLISSSSTFHLSSRRKRCFSLKPRACSEATSFSWAAVAKASSLSRFNSANRVCSLVNSVDKRTDSLDLFLSSRAWSSLAAITVWRCISAS